MQQLCVNDTEDLGQTILVGHGVGSISLFQSCVSFIGPEFSKRCPSSGHSLPPFIRSPCQDLSLPYPNPSIIRTGWKPVYGPPLLCIQILPISKSDDRGGQSGKGTSDVSWIHESMFERGLYQLLLVAARFWSCTRALAHKSGVCITSTSFSLMDGSQLCSARSRQLSVELHSASPALVQNCEFVLLLETRATQPRASINAAARISTIARSVASLLPSRAAATMGTNSILRQLLLSSVDGSRPWRCQAHYYVHLKATHCGLVHFDIVPRCQMGGWVVSYHWYVNGRVQLSCGMGMRVRRVYP